MELSEAADADLVAILTYSVENFGRETGEAYVESFDDAFQLLSEHPLIGAIHPDVMPPVHVLSHRSHHVFYDIVDGDVLVQRVLHKTMDAKRWLG